MDWRKIFEKIEVADLVVDILNIAVHMATFGMVKRENNKFVIDDGKVREHAPRLKREDTDAVKVSEVYAKLDDGDSQRWNLIFVSTLKENQQAHVIRNLAAMDADVALKTIQYLCRLSDNDERLQELDSRNLCRRNESDYPIVKIENFLGRRFDNLKDFYDWVNDPGPNGLNEMARRAATRVDNTTAVLTNAADTINNGTDRMFLGRFLR